jgi:small subunit ribosomal protein S7
MPRRGFIPKREVLADPIYNKTLVTKLINQVMHDGKRGVAQRVCYEAFKIVEDKSGKDPMEVFEQALTNITPVLEVKARRVGGATYQVPMEIRPERRQTLALRWLVDFSRTRGERTMNERLAAEILDASNNAGSAVRRKEEMHRMAEANKAFAHYRW